MARYDLAVIGGGPGGYVAAIRAGQLGMKVACIERDALGGVCLNVGCIPSKALIRNAEVLNLVKNAGDYGITTGKVAADFGAGVDRSRRVVDRLTKGVAALFRKNSVELISGEAHFLDGHTLAVGDDQIETANVIIATGARPASVPGIELDGEAVVSYRETIVDRSVPDHVVIIGGGAIGIEFAYIYNAYGAHVTVVELMERILPMEDHESSAAVTRSLGKQGVEFRTGVKVSRITAGGGVRHVFVDGPDGEECIDAERVLVSVGVTPNTEALDVEKAGVKLDRGYVQVDALLRANADGVYAVGDVTGIMPLAHVAQAHGVSVVERIAGMEVPPLDYQAVPRAVYCNPQVASMGLTEEQAREQGLDIKVGKFPLLANGKALALGEYDGFAKVIVDAGTGELIGAHLVGHEVTEILGELSLTRMLEGTNIEVGAVVNAHPTLSEAVKEAALAIEGQAIHM